MTQDLLPDGMPRKDTIKISIHSLKHYVSSFFLGNPLWKGAAIIGGGTALAQGISVVCTPIITRLYLPSDFGILGIYSAILTILIAFASLRYEFSIPLPKEHSRAAHILVLCLILIIIISIVVTVFLFVLGGYLTDIFHYSDLNPYLWLILLGFFGAGIYQALNYWAIRQRDYPRITRTRINQSIGGSASKIIFGIVGFGPIGLIFGHLISNIAGIWTYIDAIRKKDREYFQDISLSDIKSVAREHRDFPLYATPATLIFAISLQIPVFMLTLMYDIQVVGWYTLAYQMLALPTTLIAGSLAQVFYGEAATSIRENPAALKPLYLDTTRKLILISLPAIVIPTMIAPLLFPIIFGAEWTEAGLYCLPLALVAASQFVISPTSKLQLYGYNHWNFGFNIFRMIIIICGFYTAVIFNLSPMSALLIYGVITLFCYSVLFWLNIIAIDQINTQINS